MKELERLEEGLKALREADAGRGASGFAETRLRAAFREHHAAKSRRGWASWGRWAVAAACAAVVTLAVVRVVVPDPVQAPPAVAAKKPDVAVPPAAPPKPAESMAVVARPPRKPSRGAIRRDEPNSAVAVSTPRDIEDFMAIPYAPPFTRFDQGQVVRVGVPRQSLRSLGLPINEDRIFERVPADLLLGEDGVPRAIRFVNDRRSAAVLP